MLELLSLLFGGVLRLIPALIEYKTKQDDRAHERVMFELQLKADELRSQLKMQEMEKAGEIQQQLAEIQALIEASKAQAQITIQRTGNKWIDAGIAFVEGLSATVRPVLTYWYCVLGYGAYKVASYYMILSSGASWQSAITSLWTPNDHAVMVSIIGFWFVDRSLRKRS